MKIHHHYVVLSREPSSGVEEEIITPLNWYIQKLHFITFLMTSSQSVRQKRDVKKDTLEESWCNFTKMSPR